MSDEKPLHVRVAEALGWTACTPMAEVEVDAWEGVRPHPCEPCGDLVARDIPRYDTDWSATGPLIERFKIDVRWGGQNLRWWASENAGIMTVSGETPLGAVCLLILALAAAGKLPKDS